MADRAPFEPIGEQARWRVIYEALKDVPVGETITYERLGTVLDLDPKDDRSVIQQAMHRAAYELETQDKHAVDSVRGIGYRVVEPVEAHGPSGQAAEAFPQGLGARPVQGCQRGPHWHGTGNPQGV